jgi:hypothetical protein
MPNREGRNSVTEQELERLRRAVSRLIGAQQEALYVCNDALEARGVLEPGDIDSDDDIELLEASERLWSVVEDVLAILDGASADVRSILEEEGESG